MSYLFPDQNLKSSAFLSLIEDVLIIKVEYFFAITESDLFNSFYGKI